MERAAWIILFIAVLIAFGPRDPRPAPLPPIDPAQCHCGLDRLNERELAALAALIGRPILHAPSDTEPPPLPRPTPGEVYFNTKSHKYHCLTCRSVGRCRNCVLMSRREAKAQGGTPCGNCGGCD